MTAKDHSFTRYDEELEDIRSRVLQMGGLVEQQIGDAVKAMAEGDLEQMERVDVGDREVNAQEVAIDGTCALIIARRQPTAVDLRMLMGISKIVTDLERCGDKAALIARKSMVIFANRRMAHVPCAAGITEIGSIAAGLLRTALNCFARQDALAAAAIVRDDLEIDRKFEAITRQLITTMMEDPRLISMAFDVLFIAKALERIGDHAKNIAEQIIFIARGTDVRHIAFERLEEEAKGAGGDA